mmetsp:Transcript_19419/g.23226  ORF Transcript_19419/g.23226 Transcript_19419/m.23226 type:complete len:367 (+) Transcript_19419:223-1323(+)|eukprot:CAMPEP_0197849998 /NCGR_PEP_ID=MMETSP1438-20131217/13918_1 /TAXON_ID=1461541 /ORGANISM="Pterosperma sp., Strain CCMP1384" /LENGTH=366 /DNA_ID=CAMNT_0043462939 /DNA_START=222 /DNA_END=1322 /DNA_ORIENTATION=-
MEEVRVDGVASFSTSPAEVNTPKTDSKKKAYGAHRRWGVFKAMQAQLREPLRSGDLFTTSHSTWQKKLEHVLHHEKVHWLLGILLLIDVIIVCSGIGLEVEILHLEVKSCERMVDTCIDAWPQQVPMTSHMTMDDHLPHTSSSHPPPNHSPSASTSPDLHTSPMPESAESHNHHHHHHLHLLAAPSGDGHDGVGHGECHHPHSSRAHDLVDVEIKLATVSAIILGLFALENLLLIPAIGMDYIRHPLHLIDGIVVGLSLWIEIQAIQHHFAHVEGSWVILVRLWRFVRIGHGAYELSHHENVEKLTESLDAQKEYIVAGAHTLVENTVDYTKLSPEEQRELVNTITKSNPKLLLDLLHASGQYFQH